ncbi:ubiquitin-conjugating enzyme/RWD-like protein [Pelagophyceae sp. CCMP2097]|nr:ubiquitin-conjugating enzyme/RWD-like protein [Pelagophyceae sp. CCMP2097]|mmetsp:Transcript_17188/g.58844  ORF Transcript_17188/g.58844 Transcript_17188/m.58844 type:complete len:197 (+) Transcript_17188:147-737(+)
MAVLGPFTRLRKELAIVREAPEEDLRLWANPDDLLEWSCHLRGPPDTSYANGVFRLEIRCSEHYPLRPPTIWFETKIFHPNIHATTGEICLDILKDAWSPAWTLREACRAVRALLADPNADSPLNCDAGNLLRAGEDAAFAQQALECVQAHALREMPLDGGGAAAAVATDAARSTLWKWWALCVGAPVLAAIFWLA